MDWEGWIEEQIEPPDHLKILEVIRNDPGLLTEVERFSKFYSLTGLSRATYFRYQKELRDGTVRPGWRWRRSRGRRGRRRRWPYPQRRFSPESLKSHKFRHQ